MGIFDDKDYYKKFENEEPPKDEFVRKHEMDDPTNFEKVMATFAVWYEKVRKKTVGNYSTSTTKAKAKQTPMKSFVAGALAATFIFGAAHFASNKKLEKDVHEAIQKEFYDKDAFKYIDKSGNAFNLNVRDDGSVYYPFGSETIEVKEIKDKKMVVNEDDENRYRNIMANNVDPLSEVCNEFAEQVVIAAKNSGLDPRVEVRRFYQANYPNLDEDQISYVVNTFFSVNREPKNLKKDIMEKGIEAVVGGGGGNIITEGGQNENNSVRR